MKERPIIMTAESVKAILESRKTQTRRVIKPTKETEWLLCSDWDDSYIKDPGNFLLEQCPHGQVGDRLWVRETWATESQYNNLKPSEVPNTAKIYYVDKAIHSAGGYSLFTEMGKVRPSIFMREWMSRITLEITEVKVERLQEISWRDCKREGADPEKMPFSVFAEPWKDAFERLWDSLNAKRGYGWETNPWVWVIGFGGIGVRLK